MQSDTTHLKTPTVTARFETAVTQKEQIEETQEKVRTEREVLQQRILNRRKGKRVVSLMLALSLLHTVHLSLFS